MYIVIEGKKYELIPVNEEQVENLVDEYTLSKTEPDRERVSRLEQYAQPEVKDAVPKVSNYRERYKQRKIRLKDISAPPKRYSKLDKTDSMLDEYSYKGEKLFVGPGLQEEI
jgi:hypothetical protein